MLFQKLVTSCGLPRLGAESSFSSTHSHHQFVSQQYLIYYFPFNTTLKGGKIQGFLGGNIWNALDKIKSQS